MKNIYNMRIVVRIHLNERKKKIENLECEILKN